MIVTISRQWLIDELAKAGFSRRQSNGQCFNVEPDRKEPTTRFLINAQSRTTISTSDPEKAAAMRAQQIERRTRLLAEMHEVLKRAGASVEIQTNDRGVPCQLVVKGAK
jgi:hypothetical protein